MVFYLTSTLLFAGVFLWVKYEEYTADSHASRRWGLDFYEVPEYVKENALAMLVAEKERWESTHPELSTGQTVWADTCKSCHGAEGEGVKDKSQDIRGSEFVRSRSDTDLAIFIKKGRTIFDPDNSSGWDMPAKGGHGRKWRRHPG